MRFKLRHPDDLRKLMHMLLPGACKQCFENQLLLLFYDQLSLLGYIFFSTVAQSKFNHPSPKIRNLPCVAPLPPSNLLTPVVCLAHYIQLLNTFLKKKKKKSTLHLNQIRVEHRHDAGG